MAQVEQPDFSDAPGLVLYHGLASACSQKVRIALFEKGLPFSSRLLDLRKFEQLEPRYLRINPEGLVPALVVDGRPATESNVILECIEDLFPQIPLSPLDPYERARIRLMSRLADTVAYEAVGVMTSARIVAPTVRQLSPDRLEEVLRRMPVNDRRERWKRMATHGFSPEELDKSLQGMLQTLRCVNRWAAEGGQWLLQSGYSLADIALVPLVHRIYVFLEELQMPQSEYPGCVGAV